jgi:hypothetical protein
LKCIFCFDPQCGIIWDFAVWYVNEKIREAFIENWIKFTYDHLVLHVENPNTLNASALTQTQNI